MIYTKVANPIVEMGLVKALEKYLIEMNNSQDSIDMSSEE